MSRLHLLNDRLNRLINVNEKYIGSNSKFFYFVCFVTSAFAQTPQHKMGWNYITKYGLFVLKRSSNTTLCCYLKHGWNQQFPTACRFSPATLSAVWTAPMVGATVGWRSLPGRTSRWLRWGLPPSARRTAAWSLSGRCWRWTGGDGCCCAPSIGRRGTRRRRWTLTSGTWRRRCREWSSNIRLWHLLSAVTSTVTFWRLHQPLLVLVCKSFYLITLCASL